MSSLWLHFEIFYRFPKFETDIFWRFLGFPFRGQSKPSLSGRRRIQSSTCLLGVSVDVLIGWNRVKPRKLKQSLKLWYYYYEVKLTLSCKMLCWNYFNCSIAESMSLSERFKSIFICKEYEFEMIKTEIHISERK